MQYNDKKRTVPRNRGTATICALGSIDGTKLFDTALADLFAHKIDHVVRVVAENAGGRIFLQDDLVVFRKDLQIVFIVCQVEPTPKLFRQDDASYMVDRSDDSGCFLHGLNLLCLTMLHKNTIISRLCQLKNAKDNNLFIF